MSAKEIDLSQAWTVAEGAFASDGGSIYLRVLDASDAEHAIVLWQHLFKEVQDPDKIPGRIYLDGSIVPVRSELEDQLLSMLRGAQLKVPAERSAGRARTGGPGMIVGRDIEEYYSKIEEGPAAALAHLVKQVIDYVDSEDYVELARKLSGS